ncbi:hypothetical protein D1BOALGB6SA_3203 [Olavius sp. associated proteobacterium Delta 1]|nr:hypothetical protein D1BOALGB6SA_3203 [Olavius sp. associated proteobacterium Delta 1]
MKTYIIKRLIQAVGVCLVPSMISFFLLFLSPDPALLPPETGVGGAIQVALAGLSYFIYPNDISASGRYYPRDIVDPEFALNSDRTISVADGPGPGVAVNSKVLDEHTLAREVIRR